MYHFLRAGKSRFIAIAISIVMIVASVLPEPVVYADETGGENTTTTWNFRGGQEGAFSGAVENATYDFNGLLINAEAGKCAARAEGDTQVNAGTKLSVSVSGSAIIMVQTYPGYHDYTINGVAADSDKFQYTYTGKEGYVEIEAVSTVYLYEISRTPYSPPVDVPDVYDPKKIDVWDLGAEQLDTAIYNNRLTADTMNSFYPSSVSGGAMGINIASFMTSDGELLFNDGGKTNNRLRSTNTTLTRYDNKSLKSADGATTYSGYIYSNNSGNINVYLGIKLFKNDILTLCVASNSGNSTINVEAPSGTIAKQVYNYVSGTAQTMSFYASEEGIYKIYSTDEKLIVARLYREHTNAVTVNGNVTAPTNLVSYGLNFTNRQTGEVITASVAGGIYNATLNEKYDYDISLSNANGYIISGTNTLSIPAGAGNQTLDISVIAVTLVNVNGNITGLPADKLAALNLKLISTAIYVPQIAKAADGAYTLQLEKGVSYSVVAEGVNDYKLSFETISMDSDGIYNFEFQEKTKYPVTLNLSGISEEVKNNAVITFTNINEQGYRYSFPLNSPDIALRDGQYKISVKGTGAYALVMENTPNLIINGAAGSAVINFSVIKNWNFAVYNSAYTGPGIETIGGLNYYLGLKLSGTGIVENKTYLLLSSGASIDVPVKAGDVVTVNYCYSAAFQFGEDVATAVDNKSGSTTQIETASYTAAADGYVTVKGITGTSGSQTYLTGIQVSSPVTYKDTITVGASGCDYTTINSALDAVKSMYRPNNERVTIMILPGNYEEMLVINLPNITLKNASASPSTELTNKGVNIAPQAVRITSYYGHGYNYYSMGADCKYNADTLAVNKANGYLSSSNPGAVSTNGSFWNATVVISGSGFKADGIIFENSYNQYISEKEANDIVVEAAGSKGARPKTAGDTSVQDKAFVERAAALAITDNVKEVYFDNCRFVGRQDTLYGASEVVAAFHKCAVMGACDYIFGGMTAVFYKCKLVMNTSEAGTDVAYLTAAQQSSTRGYLMYNCTVTSTTPGVDTASAKLSKPGYFGRPWKANSSEVVFYKTIIKATDYSGTLQSMIEPAGWLSTLGAESSKMMEYDTQECLEGTDHKSSRIAWSTVLTEAKLSDNTDISTADKAVLAFLGSWAPFTLDAADDVAEIVKPIPENPTTTVALNADNLIIGTYTANFNSGDFTVTADGTNKVAVDANSKTADDAASYTQRIKLGGAGTADYRSIKFSTTAAATVKIYAMSSSSDSDRTLTLYKADGKEVGSVSAYGTSLKVGTIELTDAGSYYLASPAKGVNVYGVVLTIQGSAPVIEKTPWSEVVAPVISSVVQNVGKMVVTLSMVTGDKGADTATVEMLDDKGAVVGSVLVGTDASTTTRTAEFTPAASGNYTFKVTAARDGEATVKESSVSLVTAFKLPFAAPSIKGATNKGSGKVEVAWNVVKEADSYVVSYKAENEADYTKAATVTQTSAVVSGLTVGVSYSFAVKAIRGTEESEPAEVSVIVTDKIERAWYFSAFGDGVDLTTNYYTGNANDGSVTVASENGKGKLVPASTDGLAFYYTTIDPEKENFILSATVTVDSWKFSNGQEGFGLMAADAVGLNGNSSRFWNNSFMNSVTKVEYFWDKDKNEVSNIGDRITMKLGIGAQSKTGVTAANIADGSLAASPTQYFTSMMSPLETSCAAKGVGSYNLVGKFTNETAPAGTIDTPLTSFHLTIQRDNTGYWLSYTDKDGKTVRKLYEDIDRKALTQIDKDNIYVGFFASRNAKITVTDIKLTTSDPATDPPAQKPTDVKITHDYKVISPTEIGTANYEMIFTANADGKLTIKDANSNPITTEQVVKANTYAKNSVILSKGINTYTVIFTPNQDYRPGKNQILDSYETVTQVHRVVYKTYDRNELYVSPIGTSGGSGSKSSPLDIDTAVNYVRPGQKIILAGGTYKLTSSVVVPRGINGTSDHRIYLIADPNCAVRPVFDFGKVSSGMTFAGDYWYLYGFDVTGTKNGEKGLQLSGDYCTLDNVNAYENGNSGIQISRYLVSDSYEDWPSYNLVLNCTSFGNADQGYEDADGFAAKLTIGEGNVFDGCISHHNADDGWDLFAKVESGAIGQVVIKNCVAYANGYLLNGKEAGNGNGFKLGGSSITGRHRLINCIAYNNKSKGIDSNSGPDIIVTNCTSFNNESYNVALYTTDAANTDFLADGVISFRTENTSIDDNLKGKGTQDSAKIYKKTNYYWYSSSKTARNSENSTVAENWFKNLNTSTIISRYDSGMINMNGLFTLTNQAPADAGARMSGTASARFTVSGDATDHKPTETSTTTPVTEDKDKINYDLVLKLSKDSQGKANWSNTIETISKKLKETDDSKADGNKLKPQQIKLDMNGTTVIPKELLSQVQGKNVDLTIDLGNGISWRINGMDITEKDIQDVDLAVSLNTNHVPENAIKEVLQSTRKQVPFSQISLAHEGSFGFKAELKINLSQMMEALKKADTSGFNFNNLIAGIYYYNPVSQTLKFQSSCKIDEDGNGIFSFNHASDYVIVYNNKLLIDKQTLTDITVNGVTSEKTAENTLYVRGTTGNSLQLNTVLPESLQDAIEKGLVELKVTYSSSDNSIVNVSDKGIMIAKKIGSAIVTAKLTVDGMVFLFKTKVTVKKAYIKFVKTVKEIEVGESTTFEVEVYGFTQADIAWSTSKKSIAVVGKNKGKTSAVITGKSAGTDTVNVKIKRRNGSSLYAKIKIKVTD